MGANLVKTRLSKEDLEEVKERSVAEIQYARSLINLPTSCYFARENQRLKEGKTGAPTKYSKETVAEILTNLVMGLPFQRAAAISGINRDTAYLWKRTYRDFSDAVAHAEAQNQAWLVGKVNESVAEGDGHLALKMLQSRFSSEYATSRKVDVRSNGVKKSDHKVSYKVCK